MKTDKHVVITGASKGLGRAMVGEFIAAGLTVSACARSQSAMQELRSEFAEQHHFDVVDLTQPAEIAAWCRSVVESSGAPQLLINNASVINRNAPLWEVPDNEFLSLTDTNINAVFLMIKNLLPAMLEAGEGIIVNLSSGWGRSVSADVAPYCASKWAIEGMTKALAEELPQSSKGKGFAAVPLNPGIINTDMLQSCFGESASAYGDATAWARTAVPFILEIDSAHNGRSLSAPG